MSVTYTNLRFIDSNWTKEETNYLFKLVNEWDSRWYLIADRYDYPGGKERSMEVTLPFRVWHC